jgi:hypothetical protein
VIAEFRMAVGCWFQCQVDTSTIAASQGCGGGLGTYLLNNGVTTFPNDQPEFVDEIRLLATRKMAEVLLSDLDNTA